MKSKTGLLIKLVVYNPVGEFVGYGYSIYYDGKMLEPLLFDVNGIDLPRNQLYNLVFTSEERIIVMNKTIQ